MSKVIVLYHVNMSATVQICLTLAVCSYCTFVYNYLKYFVCADKNLG